MLIEVLIESVNSLFWSIIPAYIDELLCRAVLPRAVDLSDDRLGEIICILDMYPISRFV